MPLPNLKTPKDLQSLIPEIKKITFKQRRWLKRTIEIQDPTKAAKEVYDCHGRTSAGTIARENCEKLGLTISRLAEYMGLDTEQDIKDLIKLRRAKTTKFFAHEGKIVDQVDVSDNTTRLDALSLTLKLKGHFNNSDENGRNQNVIINIINTTTT
mgnify:CR=1 FL=1